MPRARNDWRNKHGPIDRIGCGYLDNSSSALASRKSLPDSKRD